MVAGDGRWDDFGGGFNGGAAAPGSLQACHGDERKKKLDFFLVEKK